MMWRGVPACPGGRLDSPALRFVLSFGLDALFPATADWQRVEAPGCSRESQPTGVPLPGLAFAILQRDGFERESRP